MKVSAKRLSMLFISLIFYGFLTNCSTASPPEGILDQEVMTSLLIDIHIAEAKINQLAIEKDSAKRLYKAYEAEIFKDHQVTDSAYLNSFKYYSKHLDEFQDIYAAVVDSLSLKERMVQDGKNQSAK